MDLYNTSAETEMKYVNKWRSRRVCRSIMQLLYEHFYGANTDWQFHTSNWRKGHYIVYLLCVLLVC